MPEKKHASEDEQRRERARRIDELIRRTEGRVVRASEIKPPVRPRRAAPGEVPANRGDRPERESPVSPTRLPTQSDNEEDLDLGFEDEFEPGADNRLVREFYPDSEPLGKVEDECLAWRLRTEVSLDGSPNASGVRMPLGADVLEHLDLKLGRVFDRQALFGSLELDDLAFLDIESTGLSGGVGVVAFLVAIGFFDGRERFVVEQYFMEDFPGEPTMLDALVRRLKEFKGLVTYNGKSFDLPFLSVRGAMTRVAMPFAAMPHLDLLHASRRIWRGRLASCSLSTIESEAFGLARESDVPGSLIPRIYMEYLRGIRRRQIVPVIDHNVQDVVSMPAVFAFLCRCYRNPELEDLQHQTTQAGLAGWYRREGRAEQVVECLERAALLSRSPIEEHSLSMHVAVEYRRAGRWTDAVDVWRERARVAPGLLGVGPCVEMAKYYEHREKDFTQAIEWTRRALECLGELPEASSLPDSTDSSDTDETESDAGPALVSDLRRRLRRLERRLARQQDKKP
ncbi:ribonuclease H-like domain-containing protein [Candidatus Sumerlaeota bacterium]|nr:ribonuclease H-like domain-containing protein [Candidatus Sumerlaeota bacterium]